MMDEESECDGCGASVTRPTIGTQGGEYCMDCYDEMPVCDDCDVLIETGEFHLCGPCDAKMGVQY